MRSVLAFTAGFLLVVCSVAQGQEDKSSGYELAQSYLDKGQVQKALATIEPLVTADPTYGDGTMTLFQARFIHGEYEKALSYGLSLQQQHTPEVVFSGRKKSWFRHSLIGGLMYQGRLDEAQMLIEQLYPKILALAETQVTPLNLRLGVPLHTLVAYIHIKRATGREITAEKLAAHLEGFTAQSFFEVEEHALSGPQSWMLASIWAASGNKQEGVIRLLNQAYDKGFRAGWPFNYQ